MKDAVAPVEVSVIVTVSFAGGTARVNVADVLLETEIDEIVPAEDEKSVDAVSSVQTVLVPVAVIVIDVVAAPEVGLTASAGGATVVVPVSDVGSLTDSVPVDAPVVTTSVAAVSEVTVVETIDTPATPPRLNVVEPFTQSVRYPVSVSVTCPAWSAGIVAGDTLRVAGNVKYSSAEYRGRKIRHGLAASISCSAAVRTRFHAPNQYRSIVGVCPTFGLLPR